MLHGSYRPHSILSCAGGPGSRLPPPRRPPMDQFTLHSFRFRAISAKLKRDTAEGWAVLPSVCTVSGAKSANLKHAAAGGSIHRSFARLRGRFPSMLPPGDRSFARLRAVSAIPKHVAADSPFIYPIPGRYPRFSSASGRSDSVF